MAKPVLRIVSRYPSQGRTQGGLQRLADTSSGGAQVSFELAQGQFNREHLTQLLDLPPLPLPMSWAAQLVPSTSCYASTAYLPVGRPGAHCWGR